MLLLASAPLSVTIMQIVGGLVGVAVVSWALAWWLQQRKLTAAKEQTSAQAEKHSAELEALRKEAESQQQETQRALTEAAARESLLEDRLSTQREVARRDADDAATTIEGLQTDLTATKEIAAQLEPTQARIGDLETALSAEKGRVSALEQTVSVLTRRA